MSFFTAAMSRGAQGWQSHDVDVLGAASLSDLCSGLLQADPAIDEFLVFVDRPDEWFVVIRVDRADGVVGLASGPEPFIDAQFGRVLRGLPQDPSLLSHFGVYVSDLENCIRRFRGNPAAILDELGSTLGCSDVLEPMR